MKEYVLALEEMNSKDGNNVGGKGANLVELASGLYVPKTFCLTTAAYREHVSQEGTREKILSLLEGLHTEDLLAIEAASQKIRDLITALPIPAKAKEAIAFAYGQLQKNSPGCLLAIRSSATAEDQKDASFAGQQESYLDVYGLDAVLDRVRDCWASLWTTRAIHYRFLKKYSQETLAMAVILQEMVPSEISGVMFTANPVNNSRGEIMIEAVQGLGEALVSGEATGQRYILAKEGIKILTLPEQPFLPDAALRELALSGIKIENYYQDFQDIEWAFYKGKFYFLQSRPITTLGEEPVKPVEWEKLNQNQKEILSWVSERFPEPIYPLDGIVAKTYFMANFSAMDKMGYHVPDVDWSKVEKGIFPEYFTPPEITGGPKNTLNLFKLRKTLSANPVAEWHFQQGKMLDIINRMRTIDINVYPPHILFEYLEDAFADFYSFTIWRYEYFIKNRLPSDILTRILTSLFGNDAARIQGDLLAGIPCITLEINNNLQKLALQVQNLPEVCNYLKGNEDLSMEILLSLKSGKDFSKDLDTFLEAYGDRETSMGLGGLANPTWREAPEVVLGIIRSLLNSPCTVDVDEAQKRRQAAEEKLEQALRKGIWALLPIKGFVKSLIKHNRSFAVFREDSHYHITKGLYNIKELFLEMGGRFTRQGILENERDIIYLSYFEMKDIIYKVYNYQKFDKEEIIELVEDRKIQQKKRFGQWSYHKGLARAPIKGDLSGTPASAGVVRGTVRVVMDPKEFHKVRKGDILVAPYTNPAWTPIFYTVAGLVVDTGGAASHAAIIAREYGIPAVMGVGNATEILKDGDKILINGSTGQVIKES